jgi:small-conductance mechanosensitive channel
MNLSEKALIKLTEKLMDQDTWIHFGEIILKIIAIFIMAGLLIRGGKIVIHNIFKVRARTPIRTSARREATLMKLLQNVLTYVIYFIAIMMILSTLHINVQPILAGAGIVGLAVGFGAQNLVRDVITGFFIIFEDQFSVGDYVRIGQFEGTVEEIGLRTTKIKSFTGERHVIPNGSINQVTNFSIHNSMATVDISIAYEEDLNRAESVLRELFEQLPEKYEDLLAPPELLGVQNFGPSEIVLRIIAETAPMKHLYISRMIRKEVKHCFDMHGIEIPYPRLVTYTRNQSEERKAVFGKREG